MSAISSKSPSDVVDFVVSKANGLKGLVDTGLESVPLKYIQPHEERLLPGQVISDQSIPIIDVSNWDDPQVADSIFEAATKWGFFQIINHGIPVEILDSVKDSTHAFFSLPDEERKKYWKGNSLTDSVFLTTSFSPLAEKVLEWRDTLCFHYIHGDDKSPALWPPVCKNQVLDYMKRAEVVIKRLLELLLKKLNVKEINKATEYAFMDSIHVMMNYYPPCPNPELTAGAGRHADVTSITLLLQDDISGLYVRGIDENSWIHIPPVTGALVINIGDALQIISNDRYKSVEHRAVVNGSRTRVSVPIFVSPGPHAVIGPLPEVLESGEAPRYKHVLYSDYTNHFFSKALDGKSNIDFAKI